jgi:hypothetical protein
MQTSGFPISSRKQFVRQSLNVWASRGVCWRLVLSTPGGWSAQGARGFWKPTTSSWSRPALAMAASKRWPCRRGALRIPPGTQYSFAPVNLPQNLPSRYQLLNGGGRREHFAGDCAISMGGLVNAFDSGHAQHGQAAGGRYSASSSRLRIGSGSGRRTTTGFWRIRFLFATEFCRI